MPKIQDITCHKVLNSRAGWTIETRVVLDDGSEGSQTIPDGASKGENEAISLPVGKSVEIVTSVIADAVRGFDPFDQKKLDEILIEMDGTPNKKNLGGNSILSVSQAVAKAAAKSQKLELWQYLAKMYWGKELLFKDIAYPTPLFNVLNGGKHANNGLSFQEFMIIPARSNDIQKALEIGVNVYNTLKSNLIEQGYDVAVGDEGGFAPKNMTTIKALEFIRNAAAKNYKPGTDIFFGMDAAAGSFYVDNKYQIEEENLHLSGEEIQKYYLNLISKFEMIYLEDAFYENEFKDWGEFMQKASAKLMVVADDLCVTNGGILKNVIGQKLANAVIIKPNQVGTLTETLDFIRIAKAAGMSTIVSHRSGETAEDTFIADLGVAVKADFIKSGAPVRGERVVKYNRLLEIYANDHLIA